MPTVTHTVSAAVLNRLCVMVGDVLGLGRDATPQEVKEWNANAVKSALLRYERDKKQAAAVSTVTDDPADIT